MDSLENHQASFSSYESLDKINNALDTLKITDDFHQHKQNINNLYINNNNSNPTNMIISNHNEVGLPPKQQLYMDKGSNNKMLIIDNYIDEIKIQSSLNINQSANEADSMKQKQLSDWYYIKTSPKTKPASPYERRKVKNYPNQQTTITIKPSVQSQVMRPPPPLPPQSSLEHSIPHQTVNNGNNIISMLKASDKQNHYQQQNQQQPQKYQQHQQNDQQQFPKIQKYKSNDFIEKKKFFEEGEKSPIPSTYKCFDMKAVNKNPSSKSSFNFGEMTSSSFEHVNVMELYENHCISGSDIHKNSNQNDLSNLKLREAMSRPLPLAPKNVERQENKVKSFFLFYIIVFLFVSRTHVDACLILSSLSRVLMKEALVNSIIIKISVTWSNMFYTLMIIRDIMIENLQNVPRNKIHPDIRHNFLLDFLF